MEKKLNITVGGIPFGLMTDENEEYMTRVANEVEGVIKEQRQNGVGLARAAIFAAMYFCDRYNKEHDASKPEKTKKGAKGAKTSEAETETAQEDAILPDGIQETLF